MSTVLPMTSLSDGRPFQVFAAATENAQSPTVRRRVCGTARSADDAERKRCRRGRSATCCRLSDRYVGARPFRHRNASTASLNDIRCGARGQCSWWSRGKICHTDSHWTLVVLLHSSPTVTGVSGTTAFSAELGAADWMKALNIDSNHGEKPLTSEHWLLLRLEVRQRQRNITLI